jgi:ketosteroid isomerase-like protein
MILQSRAVLLLALVGALAATDSAPQTSSSGSRNDEESVRAVMTATTDAFSHHDANAWVKFCTPDAQLVTVRGESMKGIAEIEKGLTAIFQTRGGP